MSRPTLSEQAWPMDDESRRQAQDWASGVTAQVLDWTWRAFEALHANVLSHVDMTQPLDQLERDLTSKHFIEIQRIFVAETDGFPSIIPHHEFPENQSRPGGCGKPPASDICFIWYANQRVTWPIEAKVVPTPGALAKYLRDVNKFTDGIAAPFVGEGAQIAYLRTGTPRDFFDNLRRSAGMSSLQHSQDFPNRPHKVSAHPRNPAPDLRLHHLAMSCGPDRTLLYLSDFDS